MPNRLLAYAGIAFFSLIMNASNTFASPGWLHVEGNQILTDRNRVWTAHGVNINDPRDNRGCYDHNGNSSDDPNRILKLLDIAINQWGATFIRLPLDAYTKDAKNSVSEIIQNANYWAAVTKIVDFVENSNKAYILVAPWLDPTMPRDPNWLPTDATIPIYQKFVDTFKNKSSVIYGLSNEPHDIDDPNIIAKTMQKMVGVIREREGDGPHHLISVQGKNFTGDVSYYRTHPISYKGTTNIIYEVHMYNNSLVNGAVQASKDIPVIIGEYGPGAPAGQDPNDWQSCYKIGVTDVFTLDQVKSAQTLFRANEISYLAWSLSNRTPPNMLKASPFERQDAFDPNFPMGCTALCAPNAPIQELTSFGQVVYDDLRTPYEDSRTKKLRKVIPLLLD